MYRDFVINQDAEGRWWAKHRSGALTYGPFASEQEARASVDAHFDNPYGIKLSVVRADRRRAGRP